MILFTLKVRNRQICRYRKKIRGLGGPDGRPAGLGHSDISGGNACVLHLDGLMVGMTL